MITAPAVDSGRPATVVPGHPTPVIPGHPTTVIPAKAGISEVESSGSHP